MGKRRARASEAAAIDSLLRRVNLATSKGDFKEVANLHNQLGNQHRLLGNLDEALEHHQEEVKISKEHNGKDKLSLAIGYRNIGEVLIEKKEEAKAVKYIKQYLKLAQEVRNLVEEQRAYITLGRAYISLSENEDADYGKKTNEETKSTLEWAYKSFMQAYKLLTKDDDLRSQIDDNEFMVMKCNNCQNLGLALELRGKIEDAIAWFNRAIDIGTKYKLHEYLGRCYSLLGDLYLRKAKHQDALNAARNALISAKVVGDHELEVEAQLLEAKALCMNDGIDAGKKLLKRLRRKVKKKQELEGFLENLDPLLTAAVRISRTKDIMFVTDINKEPGKFMKFYEILGDNYSTLQKYETAIGHYTKACKVVKTFQYLTNKAVGVDQKKISRLYFSIAETYSDLQDYDNAYKFYLKEFSMHGGNRLEEFKTQTKITVVLEKLCKPPEVVIEALKQAIQLADSMKNYGRLVTALNNYAIYLKNVGKLEEYKKQVDLIEKIKKEHNVSDSDEPETDSQDLLDEESDIDLDNLSAEESEDEIDEEKGKKFNRKLKLNEAGESQLHIMAKKGDLKGVRRLIREGHPVNVTDNAKWSPLHEASNFGRAHVVEELLKQVADVNAAGGINDSGSSEKITPLHDAASNCHTDTMKILLKYGANVLAKDRDGRFPIDALLGWRQSEGVNCGEQELVAYREVKELLKSQMKKAGRPYKIEDEKKSKRRTTRDLSPKLSLMVSKPQDYDCPIPVKIATDDFDPDEDGAGKNLYERTMKQVRRKENETSDPKEKPRPISPGPRCGLIPSELNVHDDWLLPDDAEMPELQSKVVKSHQSKLPKRKRDPVDDEDISYDDRITRRKTNRNGSWNAHLDEDGSSELLDIIEMGNNGDRDSTKGRASNIASASSVLLDDPMLSDDEECNSRVFENDFDTSSIEEDFLPSQRPVGSMVEFGRIVDIEVEEKSSSPPPSNRPRAKPRPLVNLSSDDNEDDDNDFNNSVRSGYSTSGVRLSELATVFKRNQTTKNDTRENRRSTASSFQTRLPYKVSSNSKRNSDVSNARSSNEEINSIRRTISSSSLTNNGRTLDDHHHHHRKEVLRLKVHILKHVLLVPVDLNNMNKTVEWLAGECASRYQRSYGVKPILTLQTKDGATLSSSDPISLVLDTNERDLVLMADVSDYDLPPLVERYTSACTDVTFEPDAEVKSSLNSCQSSNMLNLQDANLRGKAGTTLMKALQRQYALRILNLSGCSLFDNGVIELCKILPTLSSLTDLNLSSNGITKTGFLSFAEAFQQTSPVTSASSCFKMPIGITSLVFSHNPLGNFIGNSLAALISRLASLKSLEVADCNLTEKLFLWSKDELTKALKSSRLELLDISYNNWKDVGVEKFLLNLPASRIRVLNCSSCTQNSSNPNESSGDAIAKAISSFLSQNEDCCNLKRLQLSDCCLSDKSMDLILNNFDRLVRLESLELSRNDRLSSQSLVNVLNRSAEQNIPLSKLDMGSIPNLLDNPRITQEMILNAIERKMISEKKLMNLRLPRSEIGTPGSSNGDPELSKLESKIIELMEDYAGNTRFQYEKDGACILYHFED